MDSEEKWVSPAGAADEMSRLAGYKITPDDLKQMRRRGVLKRIKKINERISLYHIDEIRETNPPKKHKPEPIS
jgi:hypothetical protein